MLDSEPQAARRVSRACSVGAGTHLIGRKRLRSSGTSMGTTALTDGCAGVPERIPAQCAAGSGNEEAHNLPDGLVPIPVTEGEDQHGDMGADVRADEGLAEDVRPLQTAPLLGGVRGLAGSSGGECLGTPRRAKRARVAWFGLLGKSGGHDGSQTRGALARARRLALGSRRAPIVTTGPPRAGTARALPRSDRRSRESRTTGSCHPVGPLVSWHRG